MEQVRIYTDASFNPKTHLAGGGVLWLFDNGTKRRQAVKLGWVVSNVQAELLTIIHALKALKTPYNVLLYTDIRQFVDIVNGIGQARHCLETWEEYTVYAESHTVTMEWVGRNSNLYTMECHNLAHAITRPMRKYGSSI